MELRKTNCLSEGKCRIRLTVAFEVTDVSQTENKARFPLPKFTARELGPSTWVVETGLNWLTEI